MLLFAETVGHARESTGQLTTHRSQWHLSTGGSRNSFLHREKYGASDQRPVIAQTSHRIKPGYNSMRVEMLDDQFFTVSFKTFCPECVLLAMCVCVCTCECVCEYYHARVIQNAKCISLCMKCVLFVYVHTGVTVYVCV